MNMSTEPTDSTASTVSTASATFTETLQTQREAAFLACRTLLPTRYTSDSDVIDNPEVTKQVEAEWRIYFDAMADVLVRFPYTEDEKRHVCTSDSTC